MQKLKFTAITTVAIFLIIGGSAIAQQPSTQQMPMQQVQMQSSGTETSSLNSSEQEFLNKTARDSIYEFAAAQLAVQKAQSNDVADYAMRLIDDHSKFNQELMQLARQNEIVLPVKLDSENSAKLEQLMQLSGTEFDRSYIQQMSEANASGIQEFQQEAKTTNTSDLKSFISQFLPKQQEHYKTATALENSSNANNS